MDTTTQKAPRRRDAGFTLTELAVAMLIMGVLAAIAVPSFLGARDNAYDREAQAAVDAALDAATMHYANYGDFSRSDTDYCSTDGDTVFPDDLQRLEPNFNFVTDTEKSNSPREISVDAGNTFNQNGENLGCQAFFAVAMSRSGICWVGRITVEGASFDSDGDEPITVNADQSTSNEVIDEPDDIALNGRAYAAIKVDSKASDGGTEGITSDTGSLDDAFDLCTADTQSEIGTGAGVLNDEYFDSWRTVVNSSNGYQES